MKINSFCPMVLRYILLITLNLLKPHQPFPSPPGSNDCTTVGKEPSKTQLRFKSYMH